MTGILRGRRTAWLVGMVACATALVALNTAIAALTSTISPWEVGWEFLRAAGGGVLCTFTFQAIAQGVTTLGYTEAAVLDPQGQPLPAGFSAAMQVTVQPKP